MRIDRPAILIVFWAALGAGFAPAAHAQQLLEDLSIAVANDRIAQVRELLARGMDPDSVDANGDPLIVIAARNGSTGSLDALLAGRVRVDARNRYGDSAVMLASLKGDFETVRKLRGRGAALDGPGWTALIYAATGGHDAIVSYLLDQGARIDAVSPNGTTALMMAVREHHIATADLLLKRGANVNVRNENGVSALDWALRDNEVEFAERLRRAGARS